MRGMALLWGVLLLGVAADVRAQRGLPSEARLAEMGLGGIEILSDVEAATIRVYGRPPNRWGDLYLFVHGVSRLVQEPARPPLLPRYW